MQLTNRQKKQFRAIGHQLEPVVTIAAKGLTPGVLAELERALEDHELIKIKIVLDRDERQAMLDEVLRSLGAALVQSVGNRALIFRPAQEPDVKLSNLLRTGIFTDNR